MFVACTQCGYVFHVRHTRGTRIKDIPCPQCGGKVKRIPQSFHERESEKKAEKRHRVPCALCGRLRDPQGKAAKVLEQDTVFDVIYQGELPIKHHHVLLPAGSVICWHHHPDDVNVIPKIQDK